MKDKTKRNNQFFFNKQVFVFCVSFLVALILFSFPMTKAMATDTGNMWCTCTDEGGQNHCYPDCSFPKAVAKDQCTSWVATTCPGGTDTSTPETTLQQTNNRVLDAVGDIPGEIFSVMKDWIGLVFKVLLYCIFRFLIWLLGVAIILFAWVIDPKNINFIMNNPALYQSWAMVRDFLNLGFILVLLYSAFCTIFQIESYNWKKILFMLVIMALLVNFSFPICRVIIDFSNVAFYYLINSGFPGISGGEGILTQISGASGISSIIMPKDAALDGVSVSFLVAIIVFTFILMLTFMVIAVMFVIRLAAIGMLIIFSPIGIAGAAFPVTKKYSSQWWDELFKYAFFAPIMMFMIIVATNVLVFMRNSDVLATLTTKAQSNMGADTGVDASWIAYMAFFAIPIVILWVGLHVAQKMSIAGAGMVTGLADKTAKWAGKKFSGYSAIERNVKAFQAERKKREEEKDKKNLGTRLGRRANDVQDSTLAALGSKKAQKRLDKRRMDANKRDIDEGAKDLIEQGNNTDQLALNVNSSFAAPPTDKEGHVKLAQQATAYLRQDADERKIHIQNTLQSAGGVAGSDIHHILNAPPPPGLTGAAAAAYAAAQNNAIQAAGRIAGTAPGVDPAESDIRTVAAFVNRQMKAKIENGARAS